MKVIAVAPGGIAARAGIAAGDELLRINGVPVRDPLDLRFHEVDAKISLTISRAGSATIFDIENDDGEPLGIELEEMRVLSCGNDCIFCFVDQNPKGMRKELYFRDGDYRLSFLYGNYTTMTNAGPAVLRRIIEQRLSPQYISVHTTDLTIRRRLMGLKKDDHILEKIRLLHDHGIAMHTQIVLCPGVNDGASLERTVRDLYAFHRHIVSLAVVPVGLTDHRAGLAPLVRVDRAYAQGVLDTIAGWQAEFKGEVGRRFVYPSDEFFIVAGKRIPGAGYYDGFPQVENGVGMVRSFLNRFAASARRFPSRLTVPRRLTLVTGELASGFMQAEVIPGLAAIGGLDVALAVVPNTVFGRSVTVAGLLTGKCLYSA